MLNTKYDHLSVEENKYENWKKKGYFESADGLLPLKNNLSLSIRGRQEPCSKVRK